MSADVAANSGLEVPEERTVEVIGFGRRLLATILDSVFVLFLSMLLATAAGVIGLVLGMYSTQAEEISERFTIAAGLLVSIGYYVAAWASSGQTMGNFSFGIKVVGTDGSKLSLGRAVLRYVGYIVSAVALSIGFLWIAFDKHRQGWHDKIARTYVIKSDDSFSPNDSVTFVPSDWGRGAIWAIIWIVGIVFAHGLIGAALWTLGPFVHVAATTLTGR